MNRFRDMAIQNYARRLTAVILDLVQPEVAPFDPPTSKPCPRTKDEAHRMIRCADMAIRNFPRRRPATILDLVQPEVGPVDPPSPKTPHYGQTRSRLDDPFEIFQNAQNAGVKELLKSVHVRQSYHKKTSLVFFDSQCRARKTSFWNV